MLGEKTEELILSSSPSKTRFLIETRTLVLASLFILGSCGFGTTRPKYEMGLAVASLKAAIEADAPRRAPKLYRRAEYYFLKAKSAYLRKYFNKAKEYAVKSTELAEKSEFISTIKKVNEES